MFKENKTHLQNKLFSTLDKLPLGIKNKLKNSWAERFRHTVFEKINEKHYEVLYSQKKSRPNFPINVWIGLEIIKELFNYSDNELLEQFHFNLLTSYALGQDELGVLTLAERTLYNNRTRLMKYADETGINLLKQEFDNFTHSIIEKLSINTKIQRMDSSMIGSNIKKMSRIEIIVKVLQNFYKSLPEKEQEKYKERLAEYMETDADHITFNLKSSEVESKMKEIGNILFQLQQKYYKKNKINKTKDFINLERTCDEQFILHHRNKGKYIFDIRPNEEMKSTSLQNPADPEATYRKKGKKGSQGYLFNISETCSKDSDIQVITDVSVHQNIVNDDEILADRISDIKEKTPDLKEMITDAGYTGKDAEEACEKENVQFIPTQIKGKKEKGNKIPLKDFKFYKNKIAVCPFGTIPLNQKYNKSNGRHTIYFDKKHCKNCDFLDRCRVKERKKDFNFSYTDREAKVAKIRGKLEDYHYKEKCRLRPAVEGTISLFKRRTRNGKMKVRGFNRIQNSIILTAIAINFKRVLAYINMMPSCFNFMFFLILGTIFLLYLKKYKKYCNEKTILIK